MKHHFLIRHWAILLAFFVAIIAAWIAVYYADQPLLEMFAHRQTQTALTSYWMIHEGWTLAYQTPVMGYPWSIPFEFPIYQTMAAFISGLLHLPLDPVGRLLSFCFLIACAWPAFQIAKRLNLQDEVPWVFCALLWSSPLYLFWGRTFMIETAALFFTFAAIPFALDLRSPQVRVRSVILFTLFATLGLLQKVTTAAPALMVMAFVLLIHYIKTYGIKLPPWRYIFCVGLGFLIPFIVVFLWTQYTDIIKAQNEFGKIITSEALQQYNWGVLEQRWDFKILKNIFWDRVFVENAAGFLGVALFIYAFLYGERRTRTIMCVSLILFVAPIALFINLHDVHHYYQASSVLFLIAALTLAIFSLPKIYGHQWLVPSVTILFIISNLYYFSAGYANYLKLNMNTSNHTTLIISDVIKRHTSENDGIVIFFPSGWSSEFAYYSTRKAFTLPDWLMHPPPNSHVDVKLYESVWQDPQSFLGGKALGALVFCESPHLTRERIMANPIIKQNPMIFKIDACYLWLPGTEVISLPGRDELLFAIHPADLEKIPDVGIPSPYHSISDGVCEGVIDSIHFDNTDKISVTGWLAVSGQDGIVPNDIFVTLKNNGGIMTYVATERVFRGDVNIHFNQPNMQDVGYTTLIDTKSLPKGEYQVGLARGYQGELLRCQQGNFPPVKIF